MDEELRYLVEHGIIDLSYVKLQVEMAKRKEILENHPYKIWRGSNGEWYTYVPDVRKGRKQIKRRARETLDEAIVEYYKGAEENPTFDQMFAEWNDRRHSLHQISESSYIRYKQFYGRHFSESFGKKRIKKTKPLEIVEFLENEICNKRLTAKAYGGLRDVMKGILRYAKRKDIIQYSIGGLFEMLDVSDSYFKRRRKTDRELVFSESETKAMIELLTGKLDIKNAGLLLLFVSGMRVGEMSALKHEDINPFECTVFVSRTETRVLRDGKMRIDVSDRPKTEAGNREIVIPMQYRWLLTHLWKASEGREWVFLNDGGTRCTSNQFRKRLKQDCIKAGVPPRSPHKIRATYDSILLDANLDRKLITDQMGHADIRVSENNYHRNRRDIEQKRAIISGIAEFSFRQSKITTG